MKLVLTTLYTVNQYRPVVPHLGIEPPPKGRMINLRGHVMINAAQICIYFLDFPIISDFLWNIESFYLFRLQTVI